MDVAASGLTLAGAGIELVKRTKRFRDNYRDADKQMRHAQYQSKQLQLNQELLDQLPQSTKERLGPAQASLRDCQMSLPADSHLMRKRDRLKWALKMKSKVEKEMVQDSRVESSLSLSLLMSICQER